MIGMPSIIREDAEMMGATIPFVFDQLSGSNVLVTGACGFLGSFTIDLPCANYAQSSALGTTP
jgi:hypothetical protein